MSDESLGFAKELWREGNAFFEAGRLREAKRKFRDALKVDPQYHDARFNLALTCLISGDLESAFKNLMKVMNAQGERVDVKELYIKISNAIFQKYFGSTKTGLVDIKEDNEDSDIKSKELIEKTIKEKYEEERKKLEEKKEEITDEIVEGQIKRISPVTTTLKMADFAGYSDLIETCMSEIGLPVRHPELYKKYNLPSNSGIILYGPPGVGKTRFVKALAGELGIKLFVLRISQVMDMYTGNSEKNIHKVFETARQNSPSIIFLDEFDAFGSDRADLLEGGGKRTINQLLTELDGIESNNANIFVIGSTNRPFDIDPALKRSGRFQTEIYVRPPGIKDRESLFDYYLKKFNISEKVRDKLLLAKETEGYSGADIERICKVAVMEKIEAEIRNDDLQITDEYILSHLISDRTGGRALRMWYSGLLELLGKKWYDYEYPDLYLDVRKYTGKQSKNT